MDGKPSFKEIPLDKVQDMIFNGEIPIQASQHL
jgi:hypothetical protein